MNKIAFVESIKDKGKTAVVIVLLTSLFTSVSTYLINKNELKQSEFERTTNVLHIQIKELRAENRELKLSLEKERTERIKLQIEVTRIKTNMRLDN